VYDAIIVGARCAGAPTAMLLARQGYRVLLVDRATFPSDTFRNHALLQPALLQLRAWGLLDDVIATGCPPIREVTQDLGDFALTGALPLAEGLEGLYAPRRKYLDAILVNAAVRAGAELREGFAVQNLLWDGDHVIGIEGRTMAGTVVTEQARLVVGADGLHSIVARCVDAPITGAHPTLTWIYYSYWDGVPMPGLELYRRDDVAMLGFPTNDGLTCVAAFGPVEGYHRFRADYEHNFYAALDRVPEFAARVRGGTRAERWVGTADLPNFFRKPFGAGWALVGDAGYHKDPVTANGISDAFRDADLLAEAIDAGFTGRLPLDQALAAYEQARDAVATPLFAGTCQAATFGPLPPEMLALRAALRGNPAATSQYFGTFAQSVPAAAFFAPANLARIMEAAALVTA
jgi:flavin-dependent dehydrogenase